jgi:hypothetical protein
MSDPIFFRGAANGLAPLDATANVPGANLNNLVSALNSTANVQPAITTATASPLPILSGSTFLLSRAAGTTITLPAPVPGTNYSFVVITAVTSNSYKIITDAGTTFMQGIDTIGFSTLGSIENFQGNGTSHISFNMNGTTTGGLIGTQVDCLCITSTLWQVNANNFGSGTLATSFATT